MPSNQERCWANWGAKGTPYRARPESDKPSASNPRGRPRHKSAESPKATFSIGDQIERCSSPACVVLRLADDPLPIPGGLLPRRHLHRLVGIVLHLADREPLGLDLLLRLLRSHLECIRFRPTCQVFDAPSVASTCAFAAPSNTSSDGCLAHPIKKPLLGQPGCIPAAFSNVAQARSVAVDRTLGFCQRRPALNRCRCTQYLSCT